MSLRSSPRKRGPSTWPWIPACVGMNGVLLRLLRPVSVAHLLPRDQLQPEAARREAKRRHHRAIGKARNDHAAALAETAISFARNLLGGAHEQPRQDAGHARACLQRGRHGTGAEHGHPHAVRLELAMERLAKREDKSLARVIDRPAGTRHKRRERCDVEDGTLRSMTASCLARSSLSAAPVSPAPALLTITSGSRPRFSSACAISCTASARSTSTGSTAGRGAPFAAIVSSRATSAGSRLATRTSS